MTDQKGQAVDHPLGVVAGVVGLCGLAVAQPLLDVLGDAPTFFVAHGADGAAVVRFAATVVLVPAAVVLAGLLVARAVSPRSWRVLVPATYGLLVATAVVPALDRSVGLSTWLFVPAALAGAFGGGYAMWRWEAARSVARATAIGAVIFPLLFLAASPTSSLVFPDEATGATRVADAKNVMVVVFDELPLGALLDEEGGIDPVRYPGFSRLAAESTWYRNTTAASGWTNLAVPALLSGRVPTSPEAVPAEANHPHNLFRLLAATHELHSREVITALCPADRCGTPDPAGPLYRDSATVYLHGLLPDGLAERWLPPIGDRWAGFDEPAAEEPASDEWSASRSERLDDDQASAFADFLGGLDGADPGTPHVWFGHFLLPHLPPNRLPDGRVYDDATDGAALGLADDPAAWSEDGHLVRQTRQRFMLQVKYVDRLVGDLLDALERSGHDDDTVVVVASDHGIAFAPGEHRRFPGGDVDLDGVLAVPLFVRYPGEPGRIDDEPRQTIDVVPTISEELGVEVPPDWDFDGRSLRDARGHAERWFFRRDRRPITGLDLRAAAAPYLEEFGVGRAEHDLYAWGPHASLVGSPAPPSTGTDAGDLPEVGVLGDDLEDYDPDGGTVPALVRLRLDAAPDPGSWAAVAVNGTVAGLAPLAPDADRDTASVVIDPATLRAGANRVDVYLVGPDGALTPTTVLTGDPG